MYEYGYGFQIKEVGNGVTDNTKPSLSSSVISSEILSWGKATTRDGMLGLDASSRIYGIVNREYLINISPMTDIGQENIKHDEYHIGDVVPIITRGFVYVRVNSTVKEGEFVAVNPDGGIASEYMHGYIACTNAKFETSASKGSIVKIYITNR